MSPATSNKKKKKDLLGFLRRRKKMVNLVLLVLSIKKNEAQKNQAGIKQAIYRVKKQVRHPFPFPGNTNKALPISGFGLKMTLMVCGTPEKKMKIIVLTVFEKSA